MPFADLFQLAEEGGGDVRAGVRRRKEAGKKLPANGLEQTPGAIYGLLKAVGVPVDNAYLDRVAADMKVSEASMRRALNVPAPKNLSELAQELGGSVLVPGAGATTKAARTGEKVATQVPKYLKPAATAGKVASEVVLPFRQGTKLTTAVPAVVGVGGGLTEGIDAIAQVPEYNGIADKFREGKATPPAADDYFNGLEPQVDDYFTGLSPEDDYFQGLQPDISEVPEGAPLSIKDKAVISGVVGLGALGLGLMAPSVIRSLTKQRVSLQGGDLVGTEYNPQKTGHITNLVSGVVQSDQAVRQALKKDASTVAKPIMARLDLTAPASVNQKTAYTLNTGQFPDSNVNIGPVGPKLNAIASSLDEEELAMMSRGLMAKSALHTINKASLSPNNTTSQLVQPQFNDYTPAELKAFADVVDNDPKLRAAGDEVVRAYRGLADYQLEKGFISKETYDNWIKDNPDFVHLSASFANSGDSGILGASRADSFGTTRTLDSTISRSLEEGGGVQAGAAADPFIELPKQIRATIRAVEQNSMRAETLQALDGGTQYGVKKVSEAGPKTTKVMINGKETHYEVPDDALRYALEFSPAIANNAVAATGRAVNQLFIQSTVGRALNPLFSLVSASYEGTAAAISKQKGYHLGVINEALSKHGLNIGTLDPTGGIGAIPIGSVRYLWDSGIQQLANEASQSLINDNHLLARLLPDVATRQALADRMMLAYESSIKGMGQREGVFSSHIYSHEDQQQALQGLEGIMPDFASYASDMAARMARDGNTTGLEKLFAQAQNANVQLNAQWWARAFSTVSNSVRESVKYQGYASNVAKAVDQDSADIVASQTRRLGGDMGQRGGNEVFNTFADWSTFVNTAVQPVAEIGKRLVDDPAGLLINLGSVGASALAAQYLAAAMDPEVAQRIRDATDEQNASRIYFPGGLTVPMEQTFRVMWGPLVAVMNEISGLNDGQIDPNFINVFSRWAQEGFSLSEETKFGAGEAFKAGYESANPFSLANSPVASAVSAGIGFNLGMSRYAGAPVLIKEPSEFNAEERGMSAKTEEIINALLGGTISNYVTSMRDFNAAIGNDVDLGQAMKVAMSRIEDKSASGNGPAESLIFKGYERVISPNDSSNQLMYKKREGIDTASQVFRDELKYPGMSGANPKVDRILPTEAVRPEYRNTMLFPIGAVTYKLNRELRDPIAELNMLRDIDKAVQDRTKQFSTTIEQRNAQRNQLIERRRQLTDLILYHMAEAEETIQQETGDPSFTFNNMDINKYKSMPYPPLPAGPAAQSGAPVGP
jgi:Flp pilus assembly protein TadG